MITAVEDDAWAPSCDSVVTDDVSVNTFTNVKTDLNLVILDPMPLS